MDTKDKVREWFKKGLELKATHLLIVCDDWDFELFPIYAMPNEDIHKVAGIYLDCENSQRVISIYKLSLDLEEQLASSHHVFNY